LPTTRARRHLSDMSITPTAARIATGQVSWYFEPPTHDGLISALKSALFESSTERPAIAFFGDLDYSGMVILKSLRQSWPQLTAWEPGYAQLLSLLQAGRGHPPETADKTEQKDPGSTGCTYAYEQLRVGGTTPTTTADSVWPGRLCLLSMN
jgi:hypothetical protein